MKSTFRSEYTKLGLNLSYYRKLRGYTQEQLAEMIDLEPDSISKIENAKVGASLDTLFALAKALGIAPQKLFDFRE